MSIACYQVRAKVIAKSTLHIGSGKRTGIIRHSLPYIPGSFIRGATGASLLKLVCRKTKPLKNHEECEFLEECEYARLFGEESGKSSKIFFRYAYPLHLTCENGIYLPTPKTMFACENPQCGKTYDQMTLLTKCAVCSGRLKPVKGFVCKECNRLTENPISMGRITLTAIDRKMQSAAQIPVAEVKAGTLHSLDVIGTETKFWLEVIVGCEAYELLPVIENILSKGVQDEGIGGGKSRGLGKVAVENIVVSEITSSILEERAKKIDTSSFSIRLISPMILDEGKMLDESVLLEAARRAYSWCVHSGKPKLASVKLMDKRFSFETFSGWSLKEQKSRRLEVAISPGSVFQFEGDTHDETLALALASLEFHAIGSYKPHGCGQIAIETPR